MQESCLYEAESGFKYNLSCTAGLDREVAVKEVFLEEYIYLLKWGRSGVGQGSMTISFLPTWHLSPSRTLLASA